MGAGKVSFVVPTQDAFFAKSPAARQRWADEAGRPVRRYGGQVHDWEIGNEWYHFGGAPKHYHAYPFTSVEEEAGVAYTIHSTRRGATKPLF